MEVRAVLVFVETPVDSSPVLDEFVRLGCAGRLVWRKGSSLEQDLLSGCPVAYRLCTLSDIPTCEEPLAVLHCRPQDLESAIQTYSHSTRFTIVLHPVAFPPHPQSALRPQQSYCFVNGREATDTVNVESCALYVEYERNYTRRDWLQSLSEAYKQIGGCGVLRAEHYLQELGYRLGCCKKYGA